jgi:hypothetical protein
VRRKGDDKTSAIEKNSFPDGSQRASERATRYLRAHTQAKKAQQLQRQQLRNNPKAKLGFYLQKLPSHYKSILR